MREAYVGAVKVAAVVFLFVFALIGAIVVATDNDGPTMLTKDEAQRLADRWSEALILGDHSAAAELLAGDCPPDVPQRAESSVVRYGGFDVTSVFTRDDGELAILYARPRSPQFRHQTVSQLFERVDGRWLQRCNVRGL